MTRWIKKALLAGAALIALASCGKEQGPPQENEAVQTPYRASQESSQKEQSTNAEDPVQTQDLASQQASQEEPEKESAEISSEDTPVQTQDLASDGSRISDEIRDLVELIPYHRPAYHAVPHLLNEKAQKLASAGTPIPFKPLSYPIGGDENKPLPVVAEALAILPDTKKDLIPPPREKIDPPEPDELTPEIAITAPEEAPAPEPEIVQTQDFASVQEIPDSEAPQILPEPVEPEAEIAIAPPEEAPAPEPEIVQTQDFASVQEIPDSEAPQILPESIEPEPEIAIAPPEEAAAPEPEDVQTQDLASQPDLSSAEDFAAIEDLASPVELGSSEEPGPDLLIPGPAITLESPLNLSYYQSSILLKGIIESNPDAPEETAGIKSLTWRIEGLGDYDNTVFLEEDGSFELDVFTSGLEGHQILLLKSEDFGGRTLIRQIELQDGNQPPQLTLEYPLPEGQYGSMLSVKGMVKDLYALIPELGGIVRLSYSLVPRDRTKGGQLLQGNVDIQEDDSFFFALDMVEREGGQILRLDAEGRNGAVGSVEVSLSKGVSDIPSFEVLPQDERLVFTWEAIPGAENQTLFLTDDGTTPSEDSAGSLFISVKSPLTLGRVQNGILYKARLKVENNDQTFWSDVIEAVPLAPGTLELSAEGRFEQIRLSWKEIAGSSRFRIFRREENRGDYVVLGQDVPGTEYVDASVEFGRTYYYRIEPSDVPGPLSYEVPASSLEAPSDKITMSSYYRDMTPLRLMVSGEYAFIAAGNTGFYIMDVSTPQKPREIGHLDLGDVQDVYVRDEYAYIASGSAGFYLVNISEPTKPFVVMSRVTENASGIVGRDNTVFLANGERGLQIFDISQRQDPRRLSSLHDFPAYQLELKGNLLYVASGEQGMRVLDISNLTSPRLVETYDQAPAYDIHLEGNKLYLAGGAVGMVILEEQDGRLTQLSRFRSENARTVRIWEDYAMIADGSGGMKAVDISIPEDPHLFGSFQGDDTVSVAMAEDYALIADVSGLKVVRTYLYGQSIPLQSVSTQGRAYGVTVNGSELWVADRKGGVALYDISHPDEFSENSLIRIFDSDYAEDILVMDDILYVADGPAGVKIFDRFKSNLPEAVITVSGRARRILPYGSSIAVVSSGDGVLFLKNSIMTGRINYPDVRDAAFYGSYLFVGDYKEGLIAMEMTGEGRAIELERFADIKNIRQLLIKENTLYILHKDGITLADIRNPEHPVFRGKIAISDGESMQLSGNLLYVAGGFQGISIYRLREDFSALKVSDCDSVFAVDVAPAGSYAVYADMEGVGIIQVLVPDWLEE